MTKIVAPGKRVSSYFLHHFWDDHEAALLLIRTCDYYGAKVAFVKAEPTLYWSEPYGFRWIYGDLKCPVTYESGIEALYNIATLRDFTITPLYWERPHPEQVQAGAASSAATFSVVTPEPEQFPADRRGPSPCRPSSSP